MIRPFKINISNKIIKDINTKVVNFPWHEMPDDGGWDYGTNLSQTVTTDGKDGYIRIFGRGGSTGNNPIITNKIASIRRNPSELSNKNGLWLDLTDWDSDEEVLIRGTVTNNSSGNFISMYLTDWGGFEYNLTGFEQQTDNFLRIFK